MTHEAPPSPRVDDEIGRWWSLLALHGGLRPGAAARRPPPGPAAPCWAAAADDLVEDTWLRLALAAEDGIPALRLPGWAGDPDTLPPAARDAGWRAACRAMGQHPLARAGDTWWIGSGPGAWLPALDALVGTGPRVRVLLLPAELRALAAPVAPHGLASESR